MDWFYREESSPRPDTVPLKVSEVSAIIERLLDDPLLQDIRVQGEITNYTRHSRGHRYFSLSEKGAGSTAAVIKCVMWKSDADRLAFSPQEGMDVVVNGTVRLYAPHGAYQLQVKGMKKAGLGEKYLLVEQWKKELAAEGIFAAERKRSLPRFPVRVGVVTSETGAVIHDIRTVITRRFPLELVISPTAVQGEEAHLEIAQAIRRVCNTVDVVIVARGGGSFEDLFPFNHPDVVHAIADCPVPVVSAIGHEVDVTLSDLAADIRAPTPSAAAELVVQDRAVLLGQIRDLQLQMAGSLISRIERAVSELADLRDRLRPLRFVRKIDERKQVTADYADRLERALTTRIGCEKLILAGMKTTLEAQNPLVVLGRGYCIVEKKGRPLTSVASLAVQDRLDLRFSDGKSQVLVERVEHDPDV